MRAIAIITARGGSKRIPRKNIRDFCGNPIISYAIDAAINSNIFAEVMVSTDDNEIAKIAFENGAQVPFYRSSRNSDDYSTTADVLIEVLSEYEKKGLKFDYLCCIYPTAPFVTSEKLKLALKKMINEKAEAIIPVVKFSYPPQRAFIIKDDKLIYKYPENVFKRSQDLESLYHDAGQFYFIKVETFMKNKTLVCKNTIPLIVDELSVQDIDTEEDWKMAELKYKMRGIENELL